MAKYKYVFILPYRVILFKIIHTDIQRWEGYEVVLNYFYFIE